MKIRELLSQYAVLDVIARWRKEEIFLSNDCKGEIEDSPCAVATQRGAQGNRCDGKACKRIEGIAGSSLSETDRRNWTSEMASAGKAFYAWLQKTNRGGSKAAATV